MLNHGLINNKSGENVESFIREVFDKLTVCIFLTDAHGNPVYTNQAATAFMVDRRDGPCQTQLTPMHLEEHDSLSDCLRTLASRMTSSGKDELSVLFNAPRIPPIFINGTQIRPEGVKASAIRLLFMLNLTTHPTATPAHLSNIYGLTMAEHKVLQHFARAHDLDKIAEDIGVGVNTVRAHMKSIYSKVGVTKQASLLDLIKRHPSTLFQT